MRARKATRRRTAVLCRFNGCDAAASTTVGVTPLCALHRTYIVNLLDHHDDAGKSIEVLEAMDFWLVDAALDRRQLPR